MLYIFCAGGLSYEVLEVAIRSGYNKNEIRLVDDNKSGQLDVYKRKIKSFTDLIVSYKDNDEVVIANGEPSVRSTIFNRLKEKSIKLGILIDPSSIISKATTIKEGTIICPFCSISFNSELHENVLVNTSSIVGHDVEIKKNSVISSMVNLGGASTIEEEVYVGMGAQIKETLHIARQSIISMGAIVHKDVPEGLIVVGNPARPMRKNKDQQIFRKS
tara:strand:+ start:366 stop:1016 length:651 start_codon:yes stop_codon:yes gene_type:complete